MSREAVKSESANYPEYVVFRDVICGYVLSPEVGLAGALLGLSECILDRFGGGLAAFTLEAFGHVRVSPLGETRTWMRRLIENLLPR